MEAENPLSSSQTMRSFELTSIFVLTFLFVLNSTNQVIAEDPQHPCDRPCSWDTKTFKTCKFSFCVQIANLATSHCQNCSTVPEHCELSNCVYGDGYQTPFLSINGKFPGPELRVCYGDRVVVTVKNELLEETTIHWHGILQKDSPWMDGAPYVTQYPLPPGMSQVYEFEPESPGSYFYHSHINMQRAFGITGPLIVGSSEAFMPECEEYRVFLHDLAYNLDWTHPKNVFVNGKGRMHEADITESNQNLHIYKSYRFVTGKCYILDIIVSNYADYLMEFSIDNHTMTMVESDGECVKSVEVQSLLLSSGERYKVRVEAIQESGMYWMRFRSYLQGNILQGAVVRYNDGNGDLEPLSWNYTLGGPQFNVVWMDRMLGVEDISIGEAHACEKQDVCLDPVTHYMTLNVTNGTTLVFDFSIDDIFHKPLQNFSLLHVKGLLSEDFFCNKETLRAEGRNCTYPNRCECNHVVKVGLDECVEFFFINNNFDGHPMHVHGYKFFVVGQGILTEDELMHLDERDKKDPIFRNLYDPVLKDTFMVPKEGYGIIRFVADNPGYWMVHCHMEAHLELGMGFILKVGSDEDILDPPGHSQ